MKKDVLSFLSSKPSLLVLMAIIWLNSINSTYGQITVNFEADTTFGCDILSGIQFSDESTGNITSWKWDFGNGVISTVKNPSVSYNNPGSYTVKLVVSNGATSDSLSKVDYIRIFNPPSADYSVDTLTGCPPLDVTFTDQSTLGSNPIKEWIWDYGDGNPPINSSTVTHTYSIPGNFASSLLVVDTAGCSDSKNGASIQVRAGPVARFSSSGISKTCTDPLTVNFENNTINKSPLVTYRWDFGDGTTSTQSDPTKIYSNVGAYDVKLFATNGLCSDSITIKNFVEITTTNASFSTLKSDYCISDTDTISDTIRFVNNSSGASEFLWRFGDGSTSTDENPKHVYKATGQYVVRLRASSGPSCVDDTTLTINVETVSAEFTSTPQDICLSPDTVRFTDLSTNAVSWSWRHQKTTGVFVQSGQNPIFIQDEPGNFADTLIVTSQAGCLDTLVLNGSDFDPGNRRARGLDLDIVADTFLAGCSPWTLNFEFDGGREAAVGSPIIKWFWDLGNGTTTTDTFPEDPQIYVKDTSYNIFLAVENDIGCVDTAFRTIRVGLPTNPQISIDASPACIGDTVELKELGKDTLIESWKWFYMINDTTSELLGLSEEKSVIVEEDVSDTAGYFGIRLITVYNGCEDTLTIDSGLHIQGPTAKPFITVDDCDDFTYTFFADAEGADIWEWDFGDGATASGSEFPKHTYADSGKYVAKYRIASTTTSCEVVDSIPINISKLESEIIVVDTAGCAPFTVNLRGKDNRFAVYRWGLKTGDDKPKQVGTTQDLQMTLDTAGVYEYQLILINAFGCRDTAIQIINVFTPKAKMDIELLGTCIPQRVAFTDQSVYNAGFGSVKWDFGNGLTGNRQLDTTEYVPVDSLFSVSLFLEDDLGCKDTLTYKDTILTPEIVVDFFADDSTLCVNDQVSFTNESFGSLGQSYFWEFGDGNTSTIKDPNNTYASENEFDVTLNMTDITGCEMSTTKQQFISVQAKPIVGFTADTLTAKCFPLPVNFKDTSISPFIVQWLWKFGDGSISAVQNPSKNFTSPGDFDITLIATTSNGCVDSVTRPTYIKTSGPIAEFTISEDTVCKFDEVVFTIISQENVGKFSWEFGDGESGTGSPITHQYLVTGNISPVLLLEDTVNDCPNFIRKDMFIEDVIARIETEDTIGCEPYLVNLTNTSQRADSWEWDFGDGNQSLDFNTSHTYLSEGVYEIQMNIANQNGCVDTAYREIIVQRVPEIGITADTVICEGNVIKLEATGGDNYSWTPTTALSTPNQNITDASPTKNTLYEVEVSTNEGCLDSARVKVDVQAKPEDYVLNDTTIIIGEEVQFNVSLGPSFSYNWSPDVAISCLDCEDPIVKPLESILYFVDITDPFNCFNKKDSVFVDVKIAFTVDIPNAFSPNGDGKNDKIFVRGWGIKEILDFKIYNRFGELVYESTDLEEGWNGEFRGQPQNVETYIYTLSILTYKNEVLTKRGNISLLR